MKLSQFITESSDRIIAEWEAFARSCLPAANAMDLEQRRDHVADMLKAISRDLETPQSKREQSEKSIGSVRSAWTLGSIRTAATPARPSTFASRTRDLWCKGFSGGVDSVEPRCVTSQALQRTDARPDRRNTPADEHDEIRPRQDGRRPATGRNDRRSAHRRDRRVRTRLHCQAELP